MGRKIPGFIAGLVAGVLTVAIIESVSSFLYPVPENFDPTNLDHMKAFIDSLPAPAYIIDLFAHFLGGLTAGFVARLIVKEPWTIGTVQLGALFTCAGIANLIVIPHPIWFAMIDISVYLPAAYLGARLAATFLCSSATLASSKPE
ncbi:hypothetical protein OAH05_00575 [bacterium]|nr:hypothetical protein [Planctomicrobium sp.]MDB4731805.1 hypothetical protein [bacterium]MDB4802397.1 hypothetical protein [bacterium]